MRRTVLAAILAGLLAVAGAACSGGDRAPIDLQTEAPATDPPGDGEHDAGEFDDPTDELEEPPEGETDD